MYSAQKMNISNPVAKTTGFKKPQVIKANIKAQSCIRAKAIPNNQYVVSLGEALYDMLADQPDLPMDQVSSWTPFIGGAPTNLAAGMSRLNTETQVITNIGNDQLGEGMMNFFKYGCADRNIKLNGIQRSNRPTRDVLVTRSSKGDCYFSGFSQPKDSYADCFIDKDQIPMDVLNNASILVTGTLGLAYPKTRQAMEFAVDQINNNSMIGPYTANGGLGHIEGIQINENEMLSPDLLNPQGLNNGFTNMINQKQQPFCGKRGLQSKVFVDLNWRPVFFEDPVSAKMMIESYLQKADYLKVTADEAKWLTGLEPEDAFCNPNKMFEHLPNLKLILISNGKQGASYAYQNRGKVITGRKSAMKITPVDTTGAGDSFNSGFLSYLLQNYNINDFNDLGKEDWDKALQFAIATSALTCLGKGAISPQPTYAKVMDFLEREKLLTAVAA